MKLNIAIKVAFALAVFGVSRAFADQPLVWNTPYGLINLNVSTSEELIGYDAILKQAIGGIAQPVYTDPKRIVTFHLGAVAPWPVGNQSTIQPLISAGHNILKEIPVLNQYPNAQLNVFGRYVPGQGKAGVGAALTYAPGGTPVVTEPAVPTPTPLTSKLMLYQSGAAIALATPTPAVAP